MFNLNEKYFSISVRCGRNHQNKFCLRPLKGRLSPWELSSTFALGIHTFTSRIIRQVHNFYYQNPLSRKLSN